MVPLIDNTMHACYYIYSSFHNRMPHSHLAQGAQFAITRLNLSAISGGSPVNLPPNADTNTLTTKGVCADPLSVSLAPD